MESFSNNSLLPEQIWDTVDIPEKGLFFGKHSGSAMPLTWAHAEYIKLCSSIKKKKICDLPMFTQERYVKNKIASPFAVWRFNQQEKKISCKKILRIEVLAEAIVRWTNNNWTTWNETNTKNTGLGIYIADVNCNNLKGSNTIFTFFWKQADHWENKNFEVEIEKG